MKSAKFAGDGDITKGHAKHFIKRLRSVDDLPEFRIGWVKKPVYLSSQQTQHVKGFPARSLTDLLLLAQHANRAISVVGE